MCCRDPVCLTQQSPASPFAHAHILIPFLSTTEPQEPVNMSAPEVDRFYEHYKPSLAAGVIFAALFGVSTLLHTWQLLRKRTWYFIPFVIGGTC